ncbi:hypothetical protein ABGB17_15885 [Sphaerisporangium sp. B11E5]|uniref:hypothetical protein n=1 Tax=Sphaerisporangium sp. B11E5 TaxID=3153563 RepID=UPI00325C69B3
MIAAATGVLGLLVAVVAWLVPSPGPGEGTKGVVPAGFLGTWRGTMVMQIADPWSPKPASGIDDITIRQAAVGEVVAEQRAVDWPGGVGCSRSWKLTEVGESRIELAAGSTSVPDDLPSGMTCLADLTMTVRLTGEGTITVVAGYHAVGTVTTAFTGSLKRQG